MFADLQGHVLSGATEPALSKYEAAVHAFNIYRGDPVALVDQALDAAPEFVMAHILKAYLYAVATEPEATAEAKTIAIHVTDLEMNDRERSLLKALHDLLVNNWTAASVALDYHNMRFPTDLLGLQVGILTDFFRANARNMRDRIARVLPHWSEDRPGYSIVLGLYAFGLEECGDYARAEAAGREAVAREPMDCWAHHAVAHVMEMQGRAEDGIGWMQAREAHWAGGDNFFQIHNWWHKALFHLAIDQHEEALVIYDREVRGDQNATAMDLVDASALLWRLHLNGQDVGGRWSEVAAGWDAYADGKLYPFNDWHAVMAYLCAERDQDVDRLIETILREDTQCETAQWARETGLPLIKGFAAFWRGDYGDAVELLYPARYIANSFGGSHAQRDIIDWTLTEAASRAGMRSTAEALAQERLALKPHSAININLLRQSRASGVELLPAA